MLAVKRQYLENGSVKRASSCLSIMAPIILAFVSQFAMGQASPIETVLSEYAKDGNLDQRYNHLIWNVLRDALASTPYQGKVAINPPIPQPETINVFVLARDPGKYFARVGCNCAYIGQMKTIICDHALLDYFAGLLRSPSKDSENAYVESFASEFLLHWIFAHELGHVLATQNGTAYTYYFAPHGTGGDGTPSPKIAHGEEIAADDFAAASIRSPIQQFMAWLTLGDLIKTLYSDALMSQRQLGDTNAESADLDELIFAEKVHVTVPDSGDPHPPWLLRALTFEETLRSKYPETVVDTTGYYPKMMRSIAVSANPAQRSAAVCGTTFRIEHETATIELQKPLMTQAESHETQTGNLMQIAAYEEAIKEATNWIATLPKGSNQQRASARPYSIRGEALTAVGRFGDAARDFKQALQYTPNDAALRDNLAFCYFALHNIPHALTEWQLAIKLKPDLADAFAGLAIGYYATGRHPDGLAALKRALSFDPLYSSPDYLRYEAFWSDEMIAIEQKMLAQIAH